MDAQSNAPEAADLSGREGHDEVSVTSVTVALPWRKVFPRDRQTDMRRRMLGLEAQAALDNLLDAAWLNGGTLPVDGEILSQVSQAGPRWPEIASKVLPYFERNGDTYVNTELLAEMAEGTRRVEFNRARARAGAAGRWGKDAQRNASSIPPSNAENHACDMPPYSRTAVQPSAVQATETENGLTDPETASPLGGPKPPKPSRRAKSTNGNNGALRVTATEVLGPLDYPSNWVDRFHVLYEPYGVLTHKQLGGMLKPLVGRVPFEDALRGWAAWLAAGNAKFKPPSFVQTVGEWINGNGPAGRQSAAAQTAGTVARMFRGGR